MESNENKAEPVTSCSMTLVGKKKDWSLLKFLSILPLFSFLMGSAGDVFISLQGSSQFGSWPSCSLTVLPVFLLQLS